MKIFILLVISISSFSKAPSVSQIKNTIRDIAVILEVDKTQSEFSEVLQSVKIYPKLECEGHEQYKNCLIQYHQYAKSLLPYLILKEKEGQLSLVSNKFLNLLEDTKRLDFYVNLEPIELSVQKYLLEKLKLEMTLKDCSMKKSQYNGQKAMMEAQVQRVNFNDKEFMKKQLDDISSRLHFINGDQ